MNLQTVEAKLLAHDPGFTIEHTHASLTSQRSALMSAFRPQYEEGDFKGGFIPGDVRNDPTQTFNQEKPAYTSV